MWSMERLNEEKGHEIERKEGKKIEIMMEA